MSTAAFVMCALVAAGHLYFLVLEMFLFDTPYGHKTFKVEPAIAARMKPAMQNQGLYNGFLAAGLLWALFAYGVAAGRPILTFFLVCIVVAGIYGAATVNKRIVFIQSVPAAIALALLWLA